MFQGVSIVGGKKLNIHNVIYNYNIPLIHFCPALYLCQTAVNCPFLWQANKVHYQCSWKLYPVHMHCPWDIQLLHAWHPGCIWWQIIRSRVLHQCCWVHVLTKGHGSKYSNQNNQLHLSVWTAIRFWPLWSGVATWVAQLDQYFVLYTYTGYS